MVVLKAKDKMGFWTPDYFKEIKSNTPWMSALKFMQKTFEEHEGKYVEYKVTIKEK